MGIMEKGQPLWAKLAAGAALVAGADFLFYKSEIGATAGVFAGALLFAVIVFHWRRWRGKAWWLVLALAGLAAAMVETPGFVAIAMFASGLMMLAGVDRRGLPGSALDWLAHLMLYGVNALTPLVRDADTVMRSRRRAGRPSFGADTLAWIAPIVLGAVFIGLFALSNPIIDGWLKAIDLRSAGDAVSFKRIAFWALVFTGYWTILRPVRLRFASRNTAKFGGTEDFGPLLGKSAVLRGLLLFNLIFLAPNALDAFYIWAGIPLPPGLSYAKYAHRGAYPLIITALIAGGFVLIVMRPGSSIEDSVAVRRFIYLWLAQNIFLVASSILRTVNYVEIYSLTYFRLYALIWMGMVALGLAFLAVKILRRKPNLWLLNANALVVVAVFYASCFIDVGGHIAMYNVKHAREVGGGGPSLDLTYLRSIGQSSLPALQWYQQNILNEFLPNERTVTDRVENHVAQDIQSRLSTLRGWTYRAHRLSKRIAIKPEVSDAPPSEPAKSPWID
ncbi:MAG: DUF4173 domain-containing protein [Hyphomicrobiales bacterium]|nr:DUF4173 domain-containing protein [Hyphomicrobiales bacterium]